jgi:hypothetical protein
MLLNFVLFFATFWVIKYTDWPTWAIVLTSMIFVLCNIYTLYVSLDYIDKYDQDLALPIISLIVAGVTLLFVILILILIAIALYNAKKE